MTSDRAAKKAARSRMAATGEPYNSARRALRDSSANPPPAEVTPPPAIDPREHAVGSRRWGEIVCYLVPHEGRYYAWVTSAGGPPHVFPMRNEAAGRRFLDDWHAANLLHTPWDERIATVFLLDPAESARILYEAAVVDIAGEGIWLACFDDTARGTDPGPLASFGDLAAALAEFAARAEAAADRIEREQSSGPRDVIAAVLRYRAAQVRAKAAAATLGDVIRRSPASSHRALHPALHEAGDSPDLLPGVLAGQALAWSQRPVIRPPGSRVAQTPVRTLATHTVDGRTFSLVCYQDTAGSRCVAVDQDGQPGSPVCDVKVTDRDLVSAGLGMTTRGHGIAVIYGRAHDSVTTLYAMMKDGQRVDWTVYDDPGSGQRYFAIIADSALLADIIAAAPGRQVSLQRYFGMWFSRAS